MPHTVLRIFALRASAALALALCQWTGPAWSYDGDKVHAGMGIRSRTTNYGAGYEWGAYHRHPTLSSHRTGYGAPPGMGAYSVAPPPGTLGITYQIPSRPVPINLHPRAAMIDMCVPGATDVVVHDTNAFRTEDQLDGFRDPHDPALWHFTSEPLYPGLPHIYRVEATFEGPQGSVRQERFVRLIMGRIVQLKF